MAKRGTFQHASRASATSSAMARVFVAACGAAVTVTAAAVYLNTLDAPFLYDDEFYIEKNPYLQGPDAWYIVWVRPYAPDVARWLYRPVAALSYAVNYRIGGLDPAGYHAVNIALHAAASGLVFALLWRLTAHPFAALAGGLLFAVHPVHTEAVAWVVGRADVLAALFVVVMALVHLAAPAIPGLRAVFAVHAAYFLALGSKEYTVTAPAVLLLCDLLVARYSWAQLRARLLRYYPSFALVLGAFLALRAVALGGENVSLAENVTAFAGATVNERLGTAFMVLGYYLWLLVAPFGLRVEYDFTKLSGVAQPLALLGLAAVAATLAAAFVVRRRLPLVALGIGWIWLALLIVSNVPFSIGTMIAERFLYWPSVGLVIIVAALWAWADAVWKKPSGVRTAGQVCAVGVLCLFAALTVARNQDWRDAERFWKATIAAAPKGHKAYNNLANIYLDRKDHAAAEPLLRKAVAAKGDDPLYRSNWGISLNALGATEEAKAQFEAALRLKPDHSAALYNLANWYLAVGDASTALVYYDRAEQAGKRDAALAVNRGNAYKTLGRYAEAEANYRAALRHGTHDLEAYTNLGAMWIDMGRPADAVALLEPLKSRFGAQEGFAANLAIAQRRLQEAATRREQLAQAEQHYREGVRLAEQGRDAEAEAAYLRALELAPAFAEAWTNLGILAANRGDLDVAIERYEKALAASPQLANAHYNLAVALQRRGKAGDDERAEAALRATLAADERHPYAYTLLGTILERSGRLEEARMAYHRALDVAPDEPYSERAARALARLAAAAVEPATP